MRNGLLLQVSCSPGTNITSISFSLLSLSWWWWKRGEQRGLGDWMERKRFQAKLRFFFSSHMKRKTHFSFHLFPSFPRNEEWWAGICENCFWNFFPFLFSLSLHIYSSSESLTHKQAYTSFHYVTTSLLSLSLFSLIPDHHRRSVVRIVLEEERNEKLKGKAKEGKITQDGSIHPV